MIVDKVIADRIAMQTNSGYWTVNNKYFFDKAECLRYATRIKNYDVRFYFYDDFFNMLDWTQEPTESLTEIYAKRARQLREKYDYILIAFTGGSDSTTVLNSFLDNGLVVDEIITMYPTKVIEKMLPSFNRQDTSASNLMFEYTEAALPKLREVTKNHPNIKITTIDWSENSIDIIGSGNGHKLPLAGTGASPSLAGHFMLGEIMRSYENKGSVSCVAGLDKPRIRYNPLTKEYSLYFIDITVAWGKHNNYSLAGYQPNIEFFYYTIDMPELIKKQCCVVKNTMDQLFLSGINDTFYDKIHTRRGIFDMFSMDTDFFKKLLYPNWDTSIYQAKKPTGYFYQESADWFYKSELTDKRTKDYHDGNVLEFIHGIDNRFIVFDGKKPIKFIDSITTPIKI